MRVVADIATKLISSSYYLDVEIYLGVEISKDKPQTQSFPIKPPRGTNLGRVVELAQVD